MILTTPGREYQQCCAYWVVLLVYCWLAAFALCGAVHAYGFWQLLPFVVLCMHMGFGTQQALKAAAVTGSYHMILSHGQSVGMSRSIVCYQPINCCCQL
jgi:hypothetical protein